ncbi:MAG TPA: DUF167 domain-containing protein [Vicinamibacterales bacterium]|jgi:uncharacterized protein (TIGR00251 family)|nr:DUF167 domain-containing protein [Vicinamibacterales bacterium]
MSGRPASEVVLDVRVVPRSPRTRVDGLRNGAVLIRLAAPPVDGAANEALLRYLADALDVPRSAVRLVAGAKTRGKKVAIAGLDLPAVLASLGIG